jgi:hypothetical protein
VIGGRAVASLALLCRQSSGWCRHRGCRLSLCLVGALGGCEDRKLTEADCALVKERVERVWEHDAIAAQREAESELLLPFIRDERLRLGDDFMKECQSQVGRSVSEAELACLAKVETIDDVHECARK